MKRYDTYKDSGVEWIGEIPSNWELIRGKFVFQNKKEINKENQELNLLSLTLNGVLNKDINSNEGLRPTEYSTYQIFEKNDLVFKLIDLENTQTSRVGLVHERGIMSPVYIRLEPQDKIHSKYSYYYYYDLYKQHIYNFLGSGVRSSLTPSNLLEIELTLPPLTEQQQIVSFLDTKTSLIDSLIEKTQRKIELLKEKRTSLINEVVTKGLNPNVEMKDSGVEWIGEIPSGWIVSKLKFYMKGIKDGTHGTHQNDDDGEILLSGKNVLNDKLKITENERRILKSEHEKIISNGFPKKGDVMVVSIGHTLGKVCTYELDYSISFQRSVCFIRPKDNIISRWLYYNIRSDYFQSQIKVKLNKSTIGGIYMGDLSDGYITILPKLEQQQIVEYLDEQTQLIDNTISIEEKRIELLKEYRQSLISEVVTGKLKVTTNE